VRLSRRTLDQTDSPISDAYALLGLRAGKRPLLDLAQAAPRPTGEVVRRLVVEHDLLVIPGTAFLPDDRGMLQVSIGNAGREEIADFAARLTAAGAQLAVRAAD
jgi:aspartate/methionine/tyrosine aminotransferase